MINKRIIRCAIYTRKSSEEGLEQEFNSLDAQHEACSAYISSQKHEGWKRKPERYDDGGVSGGTLDRPGLKQLLMDVESGLVDMIVVYKIDRLTRSLSDFSRLVEKLEAAGCSFVSVTQAFNTSTSMGRLTLNVLLSFAQFEREVTGERIRDKIAASKKKGMWMGGLTPLGYDVSKNKNVRGLVVNEREADRVRKIFELYENQGCLSDIAEKAEVLGIRSKPRAFKTGRQVGGSVMSRGQIHFVLTNPVYIGKIRHKRNVYDGVHEPIISQALWDRVQEKLQQASARPRRRADQSTTSPLTGKLFDETGDRLTPTHTKRNGKRIRYYVSRRLLTKAQPDDRTGWRLPASRLEEIMASAVAAHLQTIASRLFINPSAAQLSASSAKLDTLGAETPRSKLDLIEQTTISDGQFELKLNLETLASSLGVEREVIDQAALAFTHPLIIRRRGIELKLIDGAEQRTPDKHLVKAVAEAHAWLEEVKAGRSLADIAKTRNTTDAPVRKRLALAFLSPKITEAILEGRQPVELTLRSLLSKKIPLDWQAQEKELGF